jgi:3-phenylpropionate/trans-cinnamate dioxygenase ferredoxin subunit
VSHDVRTVKHPVGAVDEFEPGKFRFVEIGKRSIGVVKTGDDFYAVLNICPHELAPVCAGTLTGTMLPSDPGEVEYGLEGRILRCPWHGYEFDLADGGRTVFTNFKARVRLYPVSIEDGQVMVELRERPSPAS